MAERSEVDGGALRGRPRRLRGEARLTTRHPHLTSPSEEGEELGSGYLPSNQAVGEISGSAVVTENLSPKSHDDILDAVRWAVAEMAPLEIVAGGTKRGWGKPLRTNHVLDLSAIAGIRLYEPEELILQARAATPLAEVEAALAEHGQQLAFEPPDLGTLFGRPAGQQTLGGALMANLAGPRRIKAGAARDHFLGFIGVSGRGETFKSGGRVMKNVTGYDLCKLMAGSFGTLAVLSEVTVKVLPAGEKTRTVLVAGLDDERAAAAMAAALNSSHEVSGAAHLPAGIAARSAVGYMRDPGAAVTAVRVEGPGPSVEHRCAALRDLLGAWGATEELHGHNSATLWAEVRDISFFAADQAKAIWRLSAPPAAAAGFLPDLVRDTGADYFSNWGGGLIWLSASPDEAAANRIRAAADGCGGHATLVRGLDVLRAAVPVFQPQPAPVAALSERLREQFDPNGVLNPGRMG